MKLQFRTVLKAVCSVLQIVQLGEHV